MKNYTHKSKYFCGNKISEYGLANGYVDFGTLAKSFDAVLCNDITKLFYNDIGGEYNEPEQVNGFIDNSDEIDELQEQMDELQEQMDELEIRWTDAPKDSEEERITQEQIDKLQEQMDELQEQMDELQDEQDTLPEIFQYYIISDSGADLLKDCTDEIIYYLPALDIYIWGVTHYGTSWDYVLTNIKIDLTED